MLSETATIFGAPPVAGATVERGAEELREGGAAESLDAGGTAKGLGAGGTAEGDADAGTASAGRGAIDCSGTGPPDIMPAAT